MTIFVVLNHELVRDKLSSRK